MPASPAASCAPSSAAARCMSMSEGTANAMSPEAWLPVALILGYLLGSIPFGLLLTRSAGTEDLRSIGSGSIGATNVLRTGRKGLAAAHSVVRRAEGHRRGDRSRAISAARTPRCWPALGAFLGHLFPVWLKFKGGKGVAVYIGVLIGLFWPAAIVFCVLWLATAVDLALLVALGAGRKLRHADFSLVVRPPGAGLVVRRADPAAVLRAPRQHQAVAGRHRGTDRAEIGALSFRGSRSENPESSSRFRVHAKAHVPE